MRDIEKSDRFHAVLPTFAGDYSGACSALFELDGTLIFHDPAGCTGNFVAYDEPRAYDSHARIFTSALDDMQALFGKDDLLVHAVERTQEAVGGRFIALVGSPNPMVLGTDLQAIGRELERKLGVPVLAVDTTGTRYYDVGVEMALLQLARDVVFAGCGFEADAARAARSVNLLGATPLDLQGQSNIEAASSLLESAGWDVETCWCMGSDLDELAQALRASCNVVVSSSGLKLARWMERRFGIPYAWASLSGEMPVQAFSNLMEMRIEGETEASRISLETAPDGGGKALVIGEQVMAEGMRQSLMSDEGCARVDIATFFGWDAADALPGDPGHISEFRALELVSSGAYDMVVADGLLEEFAHPDTRFIPMPHLAVSSRLSWEDDACPYGRGFLRALHGSRPGRQTA
ncbi:nitrogenase component 1 [Curtanaerobium respiraculi]|uniref:nitrogenase component 1 n=1 Tax=Curtanaerobium respiraculi TaxID=2949669 RepID=UPI0024B37A13|nr:nitrogenase component 1 [Curtanaerobium respiraculi]